MTTVESTSKSTPIESETLDSQIDDAEVLISDFSPAQIETETEGEGEGVQDPDSQDESPEVSTTDGNQISSEGTQLVEDEDILDDEVIEEDIVDETAHDDYDSPWADSQERQYPYEVPRPALTIDEASTILGKSIRAIERSIQGKWGNRLPEGWQARKMKIDGESEWRIIPPPGFRIRHTVSKASSSTTNGANNSDTINDNGNNNREEVRAYDVESIEDNAGEEKNGGLKLPGFPFSLENFLTSASHKAKNEIARANTFINDNDLDHPTIVIDRSDDVERLLRELADTQKELAQERKAHMEDMRLINQMQQSMRLLEDHAGQTSLLKNELLETREALKTHRTQYEAYLQLPWWQKIFKKAP